MAEQASTVVSTDASVPDVTALEAAADRALARIGSRHDFAQPALAAVPFFAGGSMTFDEYDRYVAATEEQQAVDSQMFVFNRLIDNVRMAPDLSASEKASRIGALAAALGERLEEAREVAREDDDAGFREDGRAETDLGTSDPGVVRFFRDDSGVYRWLAVHSNHFTDRYGTIFSERAHRDYVDWVWEHRAFPTLRLAHVPADFGQADWIGFDERGFILSSGTFKEGWEFVAERLAQRSAEKGDLGCSHGYVYRRRDLAPDGVERPGAVFHAYRSYEITILPIERAGNTLTTAEIVTGGREMTIGKWQRDFLEEMIGPERVRAVEESVGELAKRAQERGLGFRSLAEASLLLESDAAGLFEFGERQETKAVDGQKLGRSDFADRGEPDKPTTWKLPLTRTPGGVDAGRIRDAITALQPGGFRGQQVALTDSRATVVGRIRSAIGKLPNADTRERLGERLNNLRGGTRSEEEETDMTNEQQTATAGTTEAAKPEEEQTQTQAAPETQAAAPEGEAEGATQSVAPTPTVEEQAQAARTFDAAQAAAQAAAPEENPLVALARALAPAMREAAREAVEPLQAEIAGLRSEVEAVKPVVTGLRSAREEEIAAAIRPRVGPTAAVPASQSDRNIVPESEASAVREATRAAEAQSFDGKTPLESLPPAHRAADPYIRDLMGSLDRAVGVEASPNGTQ